MFDPPGGLVRIRDVLDRDEPWETKIANEEFADQQEAVGEDRDAETWFGKPAQLSVAWMHRFKGRELYLNARLSLFPMRTHAAASAIFLGAKG